VLVFWKITKEKKNKKTEILGVMTMGKSISLSRGERILNFLVTILVPVASFLITIFDSYMFKPDWQSGKAWDYALILLNGEVSIYFYPFLVYAMISMVLFLWSPEQYSNRFFVRFGIYTGTLLAFQFLIIVLIAVSSINIFVYVFIAVGLLVPILIKWIYSKARKKFGNKNLKYFLVSLFMIAFLLTIVYDFIEDILFLGVLLILASGPFWCLIISSRISIKLLRIYEFSNQERRKFGISLIAWLVPFLISWRLAYLKMLEIYSSLPTSPPDCYIATAVAKGHSCFVKSKPVVCENKFVIWINSQLKTFKCAELFLFAVWPEAHRIVRMIYDIVGPPLARLIIHPIQADLIYIILKPFEWLTKLTMRIIIPDFEQLADSIYTP